MWRGQRGRGQGIAQRLPGGRRAAGEMGARAESGCDGAAGRSADETAAGGGHGAGEEARPPLPDPDQEARAPLPDPDQEARAPLPDPEQEARAPLPDPEPGVPGWLQRSAGWSWRLIILGVLIYLAFRVATTLRVVVLPCVAALLLTALLQPLMRRLRRTGLPPLAATWCTVLIAVAVLAGAGTLAATQTSADYQTLLGEVANTTHEVQRWLAGPPFHLRQAGLEHLAGRLLTFVRQHQAAVAGTVLSGGRLVLEILAGMVLMLFVTFFLLKDGERIWNWLTGFLSPQARQRARGAGAAAWQALTYYVRGTVVVAAIHAVVIGTALWVLGVPLIMPLIILVFLAAFVPVIGILVAGAVTVLVTLGTRGWLAAVVVIAVFILENQLESHLLQPFVVGRMVRLHPLAIILVLAVGGVVAGIPGAVVAVPSAAALVRAAPYLRSRRAAPPGAVSPPGMAAPPGGAAPSDVGQPGPGMPGPGMPATGNQPGTGGPSGSDRPGQVAGQR